MTLQINRLPWNAHPHFALWANGNKLKVFGKGVGYVAVAAVVAVVPDFFSKEAGADADADDGCTQGASIRWISSVIF